MPTLLSIEALKADRRYVERQLAEVGDNPWATARHMWQTRLAEIDAQIAALSASSSNYASVALIFDGNPVIGSGDIRLDFTTDALDSYQKIISLALARRMIFRSVEDCLAPTSRGYSSATSFEDRWALCWRRLRLSCTKCFRLP